ncbi:MAG: NAD(+) synthase [Bdellovibrionales bacterium RBG_16_40_8]|nr:MAG: NAD(+) synthase [Bdellovibrionales bacterium RBG_16_40_8]
MRIALAQIDSHLGHFKGNCSKIIEYAKRAKALNSDVVVFPEASLFGYHPMDLLERESVVRAQLKYINEIHKKIPSGILVIFGAFTKNLSNKGKPYFNSAIALERSKKSWVCHKTLLPTYDVFDDARHIEPGDVSKNILSYKGKKILVTICEDIWAWADNGRKKETQYVKNPLKKIKRRSVDLVLNLSASPFFQNKMKHRKFVVSSTAKYFSAPMVYVNMVGGQDELIFDGSSFAIDKNGKIIAQNASFAEDLNIVDFFNQQKYKKKRNPPLLKVEKIRQALVLGIRDFVLKAAQESVHLGLSGGIDSAIVACLAVDALGVERVKAYAMPGPFSTDISLALAQELSQNLGVQCSEIPITGLYKQVIELVEKKIGVTHFGVMHENIQARLRSLILMAISNRNKSMLLNTSNKSELAAGYSTLYGDLAGGLAPIGDLLKRDIQALAKHYNKDRILIPEQIILRAPSAELRTNQKDQDTLPPYDDLDDSVVRLVEHMATPRTDVDKYLLKALMASEFKRWQAPPILKVSEHSFGQGRRMPIAHSGWY